MQFIILGGAEDRFGTAEPGASNTTANTPQPLAPSASHQTHSQTHAPRTIRTDDQPGSSDCSEDDREPSPKRPVSNNKKGKGRAVQ